MIAHACNPSVYKAEAGLLWVRRVPQQCSKPRVILPCPTTPEVKKRSGLRWYYFPLVVFCPSKLIRMLGYTGGLVGSTEICHCLYTWGFPCPAAIGRNECLFIFEIMSNHWFHLEEAQLSHREIISFRNHKGRAYPVAKVTHQIWGFFTNVSFP